MAKRTPETTGQVQSLVRALGALEELSHHPNGLILTDLARAIDLPRSTTHRLLTTMNTLRFVVFDPVTNHWHVGPKAYSVGAAFGGVRDLARLGRPFIRALNMTSEETVNLVVPDHTDLIYVGQQRARNPSPVPFRTGDRLPMHLAAAGRAMLAFFQDRELDCHVSATEFKKRTQKSITTGAHLAEKLALARERGYAFDCQESAEDLRCVGAPIFDASGEPVAALSISAPINRMEKPRMHSLGRELRATALKITNSLGGRIPDALYS